MSIELESKSIPSGEAQAQAQAQESSKLFFPSCCFGPRRRSAWWERVRSTSWSQTQSRPSGERWWSRGLRALKKLREWSEIVAGPKWKTFIRRFNRNRATKRMANYQYDPFSYALNFDQGQNEDPYDDGFRNFSTRYAAANNNNNNVKSVTTETGRDVAVLV
ncbi:uncharacterized protein LOC133285456 [Gastrolobium bilobum]|uniref:uncharacterized protein LOC133285456 n=1 Tax=Gastrolobium bilobum TaxID=150636 RepID=UPI002AAFED74|nr:uncharacterized protein LOC133285456 [Gastrolobium bilobum]